MGGTWYGIALMSGGTHELKALLSHLEMLTTAGALSDAGMHHTFKDVLLHPLISISRRQSRCGMTLDMWCTMWKNREVCIHINQFHLPPPHLRSGGLDISHEVVRLLHLVVAQVIDDLCRTST